MYMKADNKNSQLVEKPFQNKEISSFEKCVFILNNNLSRLLPLCGLSLYQFQIFFHTH